MGWVGDDDVLCTCTHVTCYATAGVVGWGGVGWGVCKAFIPKQIKKKIKQKGRTVQNPLYKTKLFQWVWRRNLVETGVKSPQEFLAKLGLACTWQA